MEFWKLILISAAMILVKSIGFIWAINELFAMGIDYSPYTIAASGIILFFISGRLPHSSKSESKIENVKPYQS
jgi:hypothetical protein